MKILNVIPALVLCASAFISACSGSGGSTSTPTLTPTPSVTGSQSGILTDAAVQGVSYRTSSGVTGVTGPNGEYNFNPGDTVQFSLGGLSLGNVTATGIISPIQLASGDSNKLNNLLVLFQSLDTDGNPSNGITIPSASAAAVPSSVNLSQATNTFASSANTGLLSAMTAGGITRSVTSLASATAHFREQGLALLSQNVLVMYDDTTAVMIRILPNGSYIMGQASPASNCGANESTPCSGPLVEQPGMELGTVSVTGFNTSGYQITVSLTIDTNLESGFSHPISCDTGFLPNGDGWIANGYCNDSGELINKAPNLANGIVGVWAQNTSTMANTVHIAFLPNGKFLLVHPGAGAGAGVEYASYTFNTATGALTHTNFIFDTNGDAGLSGGGSQTTVVISTDGKSAVISGNDGQPWSETWYRVSK